MSDAKQDDFRKLEACVSELMTAFEISPPKKFSWLMKLSVELPVLTNMDCCKEYRRFILNGSTGKTRFLLL